MGPQKAIILAIIIAISVNNPLLIDTGIPSLTISLIIFLSICLNKLNSSNISCPYFILAINTNDTAICPIIVAIAAPLTPISK